MKGFGSKPTEIAWHYTIGRWAEQILVDKYLKVEQVRPRDKGLDEYPCVWFSKSEDYEPTALKFIVDKNWVRVGRCKNAKQQAEEHGGLLRIGVDASRLHPLTHVIERRGMLQGLDDLIRIGTEEGANPYRDWMVSYKPVKIQQWLMIQVSGTVWDDGTIVWEDVPFEKYK
ncbi:hypothetical protein OAZ06_03605 [Synechococcus sp. AH-736-G20]|nr:hypothetical protein [Synechococcus sp. AH-736-G20]